VEGQENPLAIIEIAKLYEVQKYVSMTGHMWDGQWILANGKRWAALPGRRAEADHQARDRSRDEAARRHPPPEQWPGGAAQAKGMVFNYPDVKSFRDTLSKAGFYKEWRGKFGDEAMGKLEKYSGKLA
jgi:TRAP-type C4-dicarboxylate transport system substrate-binding protein